jgi:DNA-binding beta-propeller fold protein YncE
VGAVTWSESGTLPAGMSFSSAGILSGTPVQSGTFSSITVTAIDANGCAATTAAYTLVVACQTITVTNPTSATDTISSPFSATFTQSGAVGAVTFALASGTLPTGLTLGTDGRLSGTPTQTGTFPITVKATDSNGCAGTATSAYNLIIACNTITVTNPAVTTGTAGLAFAQTFTASGILGTATWSESGTLPAGITLNAATGVLSGTTSATGSFPIVVKATDTNGCSSISSYTLTIGCQTIAVTNPAVSSGVPGVAFSQTFTVTGILGTKTWSETGALPGGITLNAATGVLSGTTGTSSSFPIVVKVTDTNGCSGTSSYTLTIGCSALTITNPVVTSGTAGTAFSQTFTATGILGTAAWSETGSLPSGIALNAANGVLSGTTSATGSFPIVVKVTDTNGCFVTSSYTLTIDCQTITVTKPAVNSGSPGVAFSQTFTAAGILGTVTWSESGTLPGGITLDTTNGKLSGTTNAIGSFPITVTATDTNLCSASSSTYTLSIGCAITAAKPSNASGVVNSPFLVDFTQSGGVLPVSFKAVTALASGFTKPAGVAVDDAGTIYVADTNNDAVKEWSAAINDVATPLVTTGLLRPGGVAVDAAGNLYIADTANSAVKEWTAPAGPVTTLVTSFDVNHPSGVAVSRNGHDVFIADTTNNAIRKWTSPAGPLTTLVGSGLLTPAGVAVDLNGNVYIADTGNSAIRKWTAPGGPVTTLVSSSDVDHPGGVAVDNAGNVYIADTGNNAIKKWTAPSGPVTTLVSNLASPQGVAVDGVGKVLVIADTNNDAMKIIGTPPGLTLSSAGELSGAPTQKGVFPITVTATDANGCAATAPAYSLNVGCQGLTVTNPAVSSATTGNAFSQQFTQSGGAGTITWSESGALPSGIALDPATGFLSGTTTIISGSFPIVVTATDTNGCSGSSNYTLTVACPTITVTNPSLAVGTVGIPFAAIFTQTGAVGTATFSTSDNLPTGLTLSSNGTLSGTPGLLQSGTYRINVTVTDADGCSATGATYTLIIQCFTSGFISFC